MSKFTAFESWLRNPEGRNALATGEYSQEPSREQALKRAFEAGYHAANILMTSESLKKIAEKPGSTAQQISVKSTRSTLGTAEFMSGFWGEYANLQGVADFDSVIVLDDLICSIGASLSEEYKGRDGFERFKKDLMAYLAT